MAATLIALLTVACSTWIAVRYRRDIGRARRRITSGSTVVETSRGPIEYAVAGTGPAVLVVHGAGGGFDQGLDIATTQIAGGVRAVAMSRFGYLRTPVPRDASPAAQADAHAALLDALHIGRAAVVGVSAGAPSAMQFALRYPDRTRALVLIVPAAYPTHIEQRAEGAMPRGTSRATRFLFDAVLKSDFFFWAAARLARRTMMRAILGTPPAVVATASRDERARLAVVLDHIFPISPRRLGLLNDAATVPRLPRFPLEDIRVPTLVIGVADCLYGTFEGARFTADHIPGARFIGFPSGGHLWVGHHHEVLAEVSTFLNAQLAERRSA